MRCDALARYVPDLDRGLLTLLAELELEREIFLIMGRPSQDSPLHSPLNHHLHIYLYFALYHFVRSFAFIPPKESVSLHYQFETCPSPSFSRSIPLLANTISYSYRPAALLITQSLSAIHAVCDFFCVALVSTGERYGSSRCAAAVSACNMGSRPTSMRHGSTHSSFGRNDRRR